MINRKAYSALFQPLLKLVMGLVAFTATLTHAATIWTGPLLTYTQPGTNATEAANQDRLTPGVWLTRAGTQGLFNAVTETSYDQITKLRPSDTEWAYGEVANYASLTYTTWALMHGSNPVSMLNQPVVVHLISEDIYLALTFTAWGGATTGGFSYMRATPAVNSPPPTVMITNPITATVFAAPANLHLKATTAVSSGAVSNVTFFGNGTPLGATTTAPFTLTTAALCAGNYALTAVATAAGVSGTSAVVNITVVAPIATTLSSPKVTNNEFVFDYPANPGLTYVIENSSNLVNWLPLVTNVASGSPVHFTNGFLPNSSRFYRVGRLPNP